MSRALALAILALWLIDATAALGAAGGGATGGGAAGGGTTGGAGRTTSAAPLGSIRESKPMTTGGRRAGGGRGYRDSRPAPPLDPSRKVSEQDCTKPVDFGAGNLRCK